MLRATYFRWIVSEIRPLDKHKFSLRKRLLTVNRLLVSCINQGDKGHHFISILGDCDINPSGILFKVEVVGFNPHKFLSKIMWNWPRNESLSILRPLEKSSFRAKDIVVDFESWFLFVCHLFWDVMGPRINFVGSKNTFWGSPNISPFWPTIGSTFNMVWQFQQKIYLLFGMICHLA